MSNDTQMAKLSNKHKYKQYKAKPTCTNSKIRYKQKPSELHQQKQSHPTLYVQKQVHIHKKIDEQGQKQNQCITGLFDHKQTLSSYKILINQQKSATSLITHTNTDKDSKENISTAAKLPDLSLQTYQQQFSYPCPRYRNCETVNTQPLGKNGQNSVNMPIIVNNINDKAEKTQIPPKSHHNKQSVSSKSSSISLIFLNQTYQIHTTTPKQYEKSFAKIIQKYTSNAKSLPSAPRFKKLQLALHIVLLDQIIKNYHHKISDNLHTQTKSNEDINSQSRSIYPSENETYDNYNSFLKLYNKILDQYVECRLSIDDDDLQQQMLMQQF